MTRYLLPLGIFVVVAVFLFIGLGLNPREVPSPLVGKPAPEIGLAQLQDPQKIFRTTDFQGQVWLLNVWASWCVSCREEHPLLLEVARSGIVPIVGLNYKDRRQEALAWLERYGNPYTLSVMDSEGRVGIDYGVYGVPETFVIDRHGVIRYKHIGPLTAESWQKKMLPLIKELKG
ncbi:DsbE family thiol:disulfide interchange protein [Pelomicrobium methylotrophicum]|uniref:DsbE family thiol:disulfide interchange protein n=1 Tax=Pelomicrobium methylotrophicum TaxID=2602750 RepID=A0A5C7EVP6_9PROT|nr:DsbE family thiol:disulfide interchange protein [Pelomicrobium methylotrophicum]TXF11135.1 DsbE family thiol:disulfide interchange protein [Pelomicrobium methylotrophicum]